MEKAIVIGSDGIIFDFKPRESTFDYLLAELGRAKESLALQDRYLQGKSPGPLLLLERIRLFAGVSMHRLLDASEKLIKEKLRPDFPDLVHSLKQKGYKIIVSTSNPSLPYLILRDKYKIDLILATELEYQSGICTGRCIPLSFSQEFEAKYKKEHLQLSEFWTQQPNRYGLTQKLSEFLQTNSINPKHSWLIGTKVTKVPQAELIPNVIAFHNADPQLEEKAMIIIKPRESLKKILEYV